VPASSPSPGRPGSGPAQQARDVPVGQRGYFAADALAYDSAGAGRIDPAAPVVDQLIYIGPKLQFERVEGGFRIGTYLAHGHHWSAGPGPGPDWIVVVEVRLIL
jgi:hypothetical protein